MLRGGCLVVPLVGWVLACGVGGHGGRLVGWLVAWLAGKLVA